MIYNTIIVQSDKSKNRKQLKINYLRFLSAESERTTLMQLLSYVNTPILGKYTI